MRTLPETWPLSIRGPEQHEMLPNLPANFNPRQVIYREFYAEAPPLKFFYRSIKKPLRLNPNDNINDIVRDTAQNGFPVQDADIEETKKLDITVRRDSYIILAMAPESGIIYSQVNSAITLAALSDAYGKLRYVDANNQIQTTPVAQCRLVFFAASHRSNGPLYTHGLNFNVQTSEGVVTVIDPDIRYPGNGGEPLIGPFSEDGSA